MYARIKFGLLRFWMVSFIISPVFLAKHLIDTTLPFWNDKMGPFVHFSQWFFFSLGSPPPSPSHFQCIHSHSNSHFHSILFIMCKYLQIHNSTDNVVVLKSVNLSSTGRYRCEVSAEAPSFETVSDHGDMIVVGEFCL